MDTISEIQERHDAMKETEKSLLDLHQVFLDMAALVEAQGHQLNDITSHVAHADSFVRRGTVDLFSRIASRTARRNSAAALPFECHEFDQVIVDLISSIFLWWGIRRTITITELKSATEQGRL